jgi:superfamily II DNA/RNA helicase
MGSAKEEAMVEWAKELGGDQGVVFTFYGQSVLPLLHTRLLAEGFTVSVNHGQMSREERAESQRAFKAGETQIFLSSDAGARGLNLGCGSALLHYELPLLYSTFVQRSDRIHRIDSIHESVTVSALIAKDTVEVALADLLLKRNGWSDAVLEDDAYVEDADPGEAFLSAQMRKALWDSARRRAA